MSCEHRILVGFVVLIALSAGAQTASPATPAIDYSGDPCGSPLVESQLWYSVEGRVVSVEDGNIDLIASTEKHSRVRVHLVGVAVEQNGALASEAKTRVSELILNKSVGVLVNTDWLYHKKKPAKATGVVQLKEGAGTDVGLFLIARGLARAKEPRPYAMSRYTFCQYRRAESEAQSKKLGVWR
jgi:endonuclease YncB( thermonuclease family)